MDLSFLKNVEVKEVAIKAKKERVGLEKIPVNGADFRVYKNGRIFTHPETAITFNLEFGPKEEVEDKLITVGNGLDIFNSMDWQMIATEKPLLFVAIVPREGNAKIDVYGSTTYEENGINKRSIDNNTVSTFCAEFLVPQLGEVYEINWEEIDYVDLVINTEFQIKAPKDVYSIPKVVSRGDRKGESVFVTRKNISVFPLTPFAGTPAPGVEAEEEKDTDEVEEPNAADASVKKPGKQVTVDEVIAEEEAIAQETDEI